MAVFFHTCHVNAVLLVMFLPAVQGRAWGRDYDLYRTNLFHFIQICKNGLLSFENESCSGPPIEWTYNDTSPIIAGFWSNITVYHRDCHISYQELINDMKTFPDRKRLAESLVKKGFYATEDITFNATHIFVATWYNAQDNVSWNCCNTRMHTL